MSPAGRPPPAALACLEPPLGGATCQPCSVARYRRYLVNAPAFGNLNTLQILTLCLLVRGGFAVVD